MTENNDINPTEPHRPRYLPPLNSGRNESKSNDGSPNSSSPPKLPPAPREPKDSLLSFSANGRLGRLSFQAAILALGFVVAILASSFLIVGAIFYQGMSGHLNIASINPFAFGKALGALTVIVGAVMLYFIITLSIRRLHDLNLSGWWVLIGIIPNIMGWILGSSTISTIVVMIGDSFCLVLALMPGTKSDNRFGFRRSTSFWEKFFGVISLVLMVVYIAVGQYKQWFPPPQHPTDTQLVAAPKSTNSATISAKYQAPYPFTAQDLWTNILKVTALPNGTLGKAQIEDALMTTLQPDNDVAKLSNDPYFKTTAGVDWYFSLLLNANMLGSKRADFEFGWTDSSGSDHPAGMCINANEVKPSLLGQGWVEINTDSGMDSIISINEYTKDSGQDVSLRIMSDPDSRCIRGIRIIAPVATQIPTS